MSEQHGAGRTAHHGSDKTAAFTGLLVTAVALFVICYVVVQLTNAKFAGHGEGAETQAETTK